MDVYKIDITSWTSSFRYPNLISGTQPTLEVPPISTILGLINAAAGFYIKHKDLLLAYYFEYEMEGEDLETIYQIGGKDGKPTNEAKSNVMVRKFLFNNFLRIYTVDEKIAEYFSNPYYPVLLGRMNDLAMVERISSEKEKMEKMDVAKKISGQIIPFEYYLPGQIQALPQYFTDEFPRKNLDTRPFSIISHKASIGGNLEVYRDKLPKGKEIDVFFHRINPTPE
jgi:CRISPR-associated protein Cas5t